MWACEHGGLGSSRTSLREGGGQPTWHKPSFQHDVDALSWLIPNTLVTALTMVQTAKRSGVSFTAEAQECSLSPHYNLEHIDIMHWCV